MNMAQKGASAAVLFWPRLQPRPKTLSQRRHPSGILGTTLAWPAKQRKHRHHPALIRSESAARHRLIRTSEHYIDHHLLITFSVDRVMGQHSESSEAGRSGGQAEWGRAASQMGGADNTIILICQLLALEPAEGVPPRICASLALCRLLHFNRPNPLGCPNSARWDPPQELRPPAAGWHRHAILWRFGTRKDAASLRHHACKALTSNTCCILSSSFQPPIQRNAERPAHVSTCFLPASHSDARGRSSLAGQPALLGLSAFVEPAVVAWPCRR